MKKLGVLLAVAVSAVAATSALGSSKTTVGTGHTSLGTALVNSKGLTLYLFEGDTGKHLGCTGGCLSSWIPLSGTATGSGSAKASDLGTIKRGTETQVTYDGHPLYTFVGDTKAGQTTGEGLVLSGKKWYAVSPSGAAMTASSKGSSSSSSTSSGSGGSGW
jgi:predicted lipoprotein with Yx(FWY)xxD motif